MALSHYQNLIEAMFKNDENTILFPLPLMHKAILLLIYKNLIHKNVNTFTYSTRNKRPLIGKRKKLRCGYEPRSVFSTTRSLLLKDPQVLLLL